MPFKTPQGIAEGLRRYRVRHERFHAKSAALMNDTKWREVLVTASRLELWFMVAFVGRKEPVVPVEFDQKRLCSSPPEIAFERHHIGDWGTMCGPYKDIFWVLFPRRCFYVVEDGRKRYRDQPIQGFLDELTRLGKLPLDATENFIRVYTSQPANPERRRTPRRLRR